jgi:hypothetical protein
MCFVATAAKESKVIALLWFQTCEAARGVAKETATLAEATHHLVSGYD